MKKIFFLFTSFFSVFFVSGLSLEEFSFFDLNFFQIAKLNQAIVSLDAKKYKNFYAPKMYFNADGNISGDMTDGWKSVFASPVISFSQELPSLASISCETGYNLLFSESDFSMANSFSHSLSLKMPLSFNKTVFGTFNDFAKNYYRKKNYLATLNFSNAVSAGTKDFISATGNVLYYRNLIFLNKKRLAFYEKLNQDYEKLFALGKITSIELNEQFSKYRDLINGLQNCRVSLVSSEQKIFELGGILPGEEISFENFVAFCEELFAARKETFSVDEAEYLQVETERLKNALSYKSSLSFLSAAFSVSTRYAQDDFPSFENADWSFSIGMKIPCFPDVLNISEMNKYALTDKLYQLEKAKILKRQEYSRKNRIASLKLYEESVRSMEDSLALEEKRVESYKRIMLAGRLSEADFLYQKDEVEFARLNLLFSRFQLIVLKASFY